MIKSLYHIPINFNKNLLKMRLYSIPSQYIKDTLCLSFFVCEMVDSWGPEIDVCALCLPKSQIIKEKTDFVFWRSMLRVDYETREIVPFDKSYRNMMRWMGNTLPASTDLAVRSYDPAWIVEDEEESGYICGFCEFEPSKIDDNISLVKFVLSVRDQPNRKYTFMDASMIKATLRDATNEDVLFECEIDVRNNKNNAGSFLCLKREADNSLALYKDEDFVQGGLSEYVNQYC